MYEISLECIDLRTNQVCDQEIEWTHGGKKQAQEICDQMNAKCDSNHMWRLCRMDYID